MFCKRATKPTHQDRHEMKTNKDDRKEGRSANSTFKKLAVQWLNEALCFASSSLVSDSFRLRNRQLLVAANRNVTSIEFFHRLLLQVSGEQIQQGQNNLSQNKLHIEFSFFFYSFSGQA